MANPDRQPTVTPSAPAITQSVSDFQATTGGELGVTPGAAPPSNADRYALGEEIARGGMGVVYRATDTALGREVAVKVLQERYGPDSGVARRFADEARIAAQLQHPGIPPVHDLGTLPDGRPFLAMKLIKGATLDRLLGDRPDPSAEHGRFVAVFEQVCQALAYAHSHDVIHRDLKPPNVMVGAFGEVQVMDWGLAKVLAARPADSADPAATAAATEVRSLREGDGLFTQAGSVLGTPAYMPPEQAAGAVGKVDRRSDVFGLGAILAVILTGRPPFAASSAETARVMAAQGDVADCFARLAACGAEPELVALCQRCLSPRPADRPADAGEVAQAVAGLRAAADERARRAELDKVRIEGEKAAAEARALERRRRRQLGLGAAAALALALLGGLSAVLSVQRQANADLEAKNRELAEQQAEVEARFETAQKAIATFHTGVSEDALLKNDQLKELRTKLLREAAGFYANLEKSLEGKTDVKSRRLLAEGYSQLGTLTEKIGDSTEALAVQRKALALRRELAAAPGADVRARLEWARSLQAVGNLLLDMRDLAGARAAFEEQRDLAAALAAESPTDDVRAMLAGGHLGIGKVLYQTGKHAEALLAWEKARDIQQQLADANPAVTQFRRDLAISHNNIGVGLKDMGKPTEALVAYEKARDIQQQLADAHPADTLFQTDLAGSYNNIGIVLSQTGQSAEALRSYERARDIRQQLADAHPAVALFQHDLGVSHHNIGIVLWETGKTGEALRAWEKARDIRQQLAEANPSVTRFHNELAWTINNIGWLLAKTGKPVEGLEALKKARDIFQKVAEATPTVTQLQSDLAHSHNAIGIVLSDTGKPNEALKEWEKSLAVRQRLAEAHPRVAQYQRDLARSHRNIGNSLSQTGKPAEALQAYGRARDIQRKLAEASPAVTDFQGDLARTHNDIGALLSEMGKPAEALQAFEEARDIRQKLAEANPAFTQHQIDLGDSHDNIGALLSEMGKRAEALQSLEKARDIFKRVADANPKIPGYQGALVETLSRLGTAQYRAGRPADAVASFRSAIAVVERLPSPTPRNRIDLACYYARLAGFAAASGSGLTAAEGQAAADKAIGLLRAAVAAGYRNIGRVRTDTGLDALRSRPDFQQLLKDLEAEATATSRPPKHTLTGPPKN